MVVAAEVFAWVALVTAESANCDVAAPPSMAVHDTTVLQDGKENEKLDPHYHRPFLLAMFSCARMYE